MQGARPKQYLVVHAIYHCACNMSLRMRYASVHAIYRYAYKVQRPVQQVPPGLLFRKFSAL